MTKYRVVGNHDVDGVSPGGTVDIDERRGRSLVRAGHLKSIQPAKKTERKGTADGNVRSR